MMYIIMYVLDDLDRLDRVLDAWRKAGVSGVTIIREYRHPSAADLPSAHPPSFRL